VAAHSSDCELICEYCDPAVARECRVEPRLGSSS
jgi:hypothetical protein